jgi:hypothetical protein
MDSKAKMNDKQLRTYDSICFTDLAYELIFPDRKKIEQKIKRRLKYHKLGDFNQERVDYIRELKNELYAEISKTNQSNYFHKSKSDYASLSDFDFEKMTEDFHKKYDQLDQEELKGMICFAIHVYYMR